MPRRARVSGAVLADELWKGIQENAAGQCQGDTGHYGWGVAAEDQECGEAGDDAKGVVEVARAPVHLGGWCDALVDVFPMSQEDVFAGPALEASDEGVAGIEEVGGEDYDAGQEAYWCPLLAREGGRVESYSGQTEAEEVGPGVPDENGGGAYVPDQEPRGGTDERGKEAAHRADDRGEKERVHERDAARETVDSVHEIEGVAQRDDPEHRDAEDEYAQCPGGRRD